MTYFVPCRKPKNTKLCDLQVQITSGALRVSKFWSRERRLFAWQIKPHNFYLGTVYIVHREVKDLPRFEGHLENRISYDIVRQRMSKFRSRSTGPQLTGSMSQHGLVQNH